MWLSLIVDEEDMKHIKPLPNLDYKVMQGNSLLEEFEGIKLFDEKYVTGVDFDKKKLEELKEKQSKLSRKYKELDVFGKSNPAELLAKDSELIAIDKELKQLKQPKINLKQQLSLMN